MLSPVITATLQRATGNYSLAMGLAAGLLFAASSMMACLSMLALPKEAMSSAETKAADVPCETLSSVSAKFWKIQQKNKISELHGG